MLSGLPDQKAWGKKRKQFYGADVDDNIGELLLTRFMDSVSVLAHRAVIRMARNVQPLLDCVDSIKIVAHSDQCYYITWYVK